MILKTPFETSQKVHVFIGLSIALWIYLFLVFVGPYDASPLAITWRAQIMIGYGILFLLSYAVSVFFQNILYRKIGSWNALLEIAVVLVTFIIFLPISFGYYKSEWILGEYDFEHYLPYMYLPTLTIVVPLLFLLRWTFIRLMTKRKVSLNNYYEIRGENKLDILRIRFSDLVCVVAANNYTEVYYLKGEMLQKKLLRITLSKIHEQIPNLIRSHRSYLINPEQFVKWEDKNNLRLRNLTIPVSRNYKSIVKSKITTHP